MIMTMQIFIKDSYTDVTILNTLEGTIVAVEALPIGTYQDTITAICCRCVCSATNSKYYYNCECCTKLCL